MSRRWTRILLSAVLVTACSGKNESGDAAPSATSTPLVGEESDASPTPREVEREIDRLESELSATPRSDVIGDKAPRSHR